MSIAEDIARLNVASGAIIGGLNRRLLRRASRRLADLERRTDRLVNTPARQAGALERPVKEPLPLREPVPTTVYISDGEGAERRAQARLQRAIDLRDQKAAAAAELRRQGAEWQRQEAALRTRYVTGERGGVEYEMANCRLQLEMLRTQITNADVDVAGADQSVSRAQLALNAVQVKLAQARTMLEDDLEDFD